VEPAHLLGGEAVGLPVPAQPAGPEDLVAVDGPDPGHEGRVGEQGSQPFVPGPEAGPEGLPGHGVGQRVDGAGPAVGQLGQLLLPGQEQLAGLPKVQDPQVAADREAEHGVGLAVHQGGAALLEEPSGGAQVDHQGGRVRAAVEAEHEEVAEAGGGAELAAMEPVGELPAVAVATHHLGRPHLDRLDLPAADLFVEVVAEGLDLRQLGHGLLRRAASPERPRAGRGAV
jgi:hypothetical protein